MKQTLLFENLTCAHCASKIEQKIAATEGYEAVSFNFATKRLQFNSEKTDCREEIQAILTMTTAITTTMTTTTTAITMTTAKKAKPKPPC